MIIEAIQLGLTRDRASLGEAGLPTMKTVGVLGCGLMGAGIAQVSAAAGFQTIVLEVNEAVLAKGLAASRSSSRAAWPRAR